MKNGFGEALDIDGVSDHELEELERAEEYGAEHLSVLAGQECPVCRRKESTFSELEREIPFGEKKVKSYIFSMSCAACGFRKADVELAEAGEPASYELELSSPEDLNIYVIKSAEAAVRIPDIVSIEPGPASNGYITTIEGLLKRVVRAIELAKEHADEPKEIAKANALLARLNAALEGKAKLTVIIEDKTGNSAILSPKALKHAIA